MTNMSIEFEKMSAWRKLKSELDEGRRSGEENGWKSADEVRAHLEERYSGRDIAVLSTDDHCP